ncbi:MAG: anaerobic ribonucleoside-triphosphate reductase activating protein [Clostridia bacterium]
MEIAGIQKLTLLDYPGFVACTVFTSGCNFRCPFCHNAELVIGCRERDPQAEDVFWKLLEQRRGILEGVVISGGEPLLQHDLEAFIFSVKEKGYRVKLDTNGSLPERLRALISGNLVDFVAMDVKNSPQKYALTSGVAADVESVGRSIALLLEGNVPYEFRTTAVKGLHTAEDFSEIGRWIEGAEHYYIQCFQDSGGLISQGWEKPSAQDLAAFLAAAKEYVPRAVLRGVS